MQFFLMSKIVQKNTQNIVNQHKQSLQLKRPRFDNRLVVNTCRRVDVQAQILMHGGVSCVQPLRQRHLTVLLQQLHQTLSHKQHKRNEYTNARRCIGLLSMTLPTTVCPSASQWWPLLPSHAAAAVDLTNKTPHTTKHRIYWFFFFFCCSIIYL